MLGKKTVAHFEPCWLSVLGRFFMNNKRFFSHSRNRENEKTITVQLMYHYCQHHHCTAVPQDQTGTFGVSKQLLLDFDSRLHVVCRMNVAERTRRDTV